LHWDLGGCGVQFAEIFGRELDVDGAEVFFEAMQLGGAGDRNDPGFWASNQARAI